MVSRRNLVNAIATTLGNIPELMAALVGTNPIHPYIDFNPTSNSIDKAVYQMQAGQLLVVWAETRLTRDTMQKWSHVVEICYRSLPDQSDLDLGDLIVNGVPNPGDGMVWRNCPVMAGVLGTDIMEIVRRTDSEGVDFQVILTETAETGDWPNP